MTATSKTLPRLVAGVSIFPTPKAAEITRGRKALVVKHVQKAKSHDVAEVLEAVVRDRRYKTPAQFKVKDARWILRGLIREGALKVKTRQARHAAA